LDARAPPSLSESELLLLEELLLSSLEEEEEELEEESLLLLSSLLLLLLLLSSLLLLLLLEELLSSSLLLLLLLLSCFAFCFFLSSLLGLGGTGAAGGLGLSSSGSSLASRNLCLCNYTHESTHKCTHALNAKQQQGWVPRASPCLGVQLKAAWTLQILRALQPVVVPIHSTQTNYTGL